MTCIRQWCKYKYKYKLCMHVCVCVCVLVGMVTELVCLTGEGPLVSSF